ncbi:hypothetical protein KI688_008298 [Linnemannia hyalina]|uniref:Uncharacterized protein n=1 Tax=Linnemannia hyalina TaxID=64524 RepID=A0A9P7Y1V4_9FUNG|nr:hypothetical protein KI688_008298 [Linnemannia hyalina]
MRSPPTYLCLVAATAALALVSMVMCASAADEGLGDTVDQEELSPLLLTGSPEFYRKEILGYYHDLALELDTQQQHHQQQHQQQEQHAIATATAADDCTDAPQVLVDGINAVETQLATILGSLPFGSVVQYIITAAFKVLLTALDGPGKLIGTSLTGVAINLSFGTLKGALSLLALIKFLKPILTPVIDILSTVQTTILSTIGCFAGKGYHLNRLEQPEEAMVETTTAATAVGYEAQKQVKQREEQEQQQGAIDSPLSVGHCAWIAKNYQQVVTDAIAHNPVTTGRLPEGSSEDLRRLAQGSLDTLRWMQKYSLASNLSPLSDNINDDSSDGVNLATGFALTGRPFFAGKILDQFMVALLETVNIEPGNDDDYEHDETVLYALTSLGLTVNLSNALEACLSAATP